MPDLVLVRHGQSTWNQENLFTGWVDVPLTDRGRAEARDAGLQLKSAPDLDLAVLHTSVLKRAVQTANLLLEELDREWLPVRRHWRLNERHYGALQGRNKAEMTEKYGADQVKRWRRSYADPPPALEASDPQNPANDDRYRDVPRNELPLTECLKDVVARMEPYWTDSIAPDLHEFGAVLVVAHGNSIRALRKLLEGISDDDIVGLEIPTGVPYLMRLEEDLTFTGDGQLLGDPEAIAAATEEVRRQAG